MTVDRQAWTPDGSLAAEVESQFARTIASYEAHPALVLEHANHEESIRTGGYANRTLLELVQNAADALAGAESDQVDPAKGRVEIVLDEHGGTLYCANAGLPFSAQGIEAITMAHLSGKRGDEIGRFGLGFKSVLAVSGAPQVFSRSVSFEYGTQLARSALARVNPAAKRLPVLRTATVADAPAAFDRDPILAELATWATTIVRLPDLHAQDRLRKDIREFNSEFLLFVSAVREIRLRILGEEPFATSHVSRSLGDDVYKIEAPDGGGEEWFVAERMHRPSHDARRQVGEAVSRPEVKVTVAMPRRRARLRTGRFWSYFPLQDTTSASALFNAPWSVNDDRTTLLANDYNREILRTLSVAFVDLLPRVRTTDDPATHLDYMPARGREDHGFGDENVIGHVRRIASDQALIPDADGNLRYANEVRPLDFDISFEPKIHEGWQISPNTGRDVPHWICYVNATRILRLRTLYAVAELPGKIDVGRADEDAALRHLPKRGLLSWLREWAEGADPRSAANALRTVLGKRSLPDIEKAKVIPTTGGMRSVADRHVVFLHQEEGVEIEGAVFVDPTFLMEPDVEKQLRGVGFRDLDPEAILNARLSTLSVQSTEEDLAKLWDAVLNVPVSVATKAMQTHPAVVRVPTSDGGWAWPRQVVDLDIPLGTELAPRTLDRGRCLPEVAHRLGVVRQPVKSFSAEDEPFFETYRDWVLMTLNEKRGPGERPIEHVEFTPGEGSGPFSVLLMLQDAGAPPQTRETWTIALLTLGDQEWACEDLDTGRTYPVSSPVRWAVDRAGLLRTNRGFRAPSQVVAPSLLKYEPLLPLFKGPHGIVDILGLPDELSEVPPRVLSEMLEASSFAPTIKNDVLIEFIVTAARLGFPDGKPTSIPSRVGKTIEPHAPRDVFIATDDEQQKYLADRRRPYLRATESEAKDLRDIAGCRRFEDSFAFSMVVDGQQERQPILDVFPGLRNSMAAGRIGSRTVSRARLLTKRVTTEDGVEDQPLDWYPDGADLVVSAGADERRTLMFVSEAFDLWFDNQQLDQVLQAGLDHLLEEQRKRACAVESDAERLELYIGDEDLMDALPPGLWSALEVQNLVDDDTSVAELFLTVYGSDAVRELAERFREVGFADVPTKWAGGSAAITWVRKMGFGTEYAGQRTQSRPDEFVVPGAVKLPDLHSYQKQIGERLRAVLTHRSDEGRAEKAMVELPTGAGKTRVATQTALRLFADDVLSGTILWIAQSIELCEQAVRTFETVWRYLGDERPLTIGRLWEGNTVHEPDTELSIVVATDAKLAAVIDKTEYEWLSRPTAVFIDEAHRSSSPRYTQVLEWLGVDGRNWERPLVGLSATPFKGRGDDNEGTKTLAARFGRNRLTAFDENAYEKLVKLGVLASVKHEVLPGVEIELNTIERSNLSESPRLIDRNLYEKIGRSEARMKILVNHIMEVHEQNPEWPILVFTPSVLSAQVLAASLRYRNVNADSVSGQTGRQRRRDVIRKFQDGEIKVLANCDLLVQGFDAPGVRALYIARPTFSPSAYIQMAGRGLRGTENGGKEECLVVDVADNWGAMNDFLGYHEYADLWKRQR